MENFQELNLPSKLLKALEKMNFAIPTPVQAQTIPLAMKGEDILGTAQTGTGKTGAFAIPLAAKLIENPEESLVVLAPTRELALQVNAVFTQLISFDKSIKSALLIGGESIDRQFRQLRQRPRVIVGTPGRMNDHINRRTLDLRKTRSLVLDESDLMLDMGFDVQIETIIDEMPEDRQTLMFSATLPKKIEKMAARYLKNPTRISVGQQSTPVQGIEQETVMIQDTDKYPQLIDQLDQRAGSIIIFVKTKRGADKLARRLNDEKYKSAAIHGDLRQSKRESVLRGFRKEKYRIMVATDVAARGIDVPHIRHVINYDLPQCPEDYIHRIGRTGRAGEKGSAVSFITRQDRGKWYAIERLLDPNAKQDDSRGGRGSFSRGAPRGGRKSFSKGSSRRDDRPFSRDSPWKDRDSSRGGERGGDRRNERGGDRGSFSKGSSWKDRDSSRGGERGGDRRNERGGDRGSFSKGSSWKDRDPSRGGERGGDRRNERGGDRPSFSKGGSSKRDGNSFSRGKPRLTTGSFKKSDKRPRASA